MLKIRNNYYKCKEKFVILKSIGIIAIKVVKQGQSSTPADIPVDILIPNHSANEKIITVVILSFEVVLVSSPNTIIVTKK